MLRDSEPPAVGRNRRDRQERIRQRALADGFVRTDALAAELGVSTMTVHRDLDALAEQGWLHKVRGGASVRPSAHFHGEVRARIGEMAEEKVAIAEAALALVTPGDAIMIDESTTALRFAEQLPGRGPLTVITHFLAVIRLLAGEPGIDLIALGGTYHAAYDAFFGVSTAEQARPLRADALFMSTTSVTDGYCYHQSQDTILVDRAQIEASALRVLMVDHSKFERRGLYQLAAIADFDVVILDAGTSAHDRAALRGTGTTVHVAGVDDPATLRSLAKTSRTRRAAAPAPPPWSTSVTAPASPR